MARNKLYDCWRCGKKFRAPRGLRFTYCWCDDCVKRYWPQGWSQLIKRIEESQ